MITAQARNIAVDPHAPMLPLAMDAALVQYRRIVQRGLEAEQGGRWGWRHRRTPCLFTFRPSPLRTSESRRLPAAA